MNKQEILKDVYLQTCPICKLKMCLWLSEEGMEQDSYVCQDCTAEVILEIKRVVKSVTIYDPNKDKETNFK